MSGISKNEWENDSSIYLQHSSSFYQWIIYTVILLMIGVFLFLFFGFSEIVIRTNGQLTSEKSETIQIITEMEIKQNYLKENLKVQKGDVLVEFDQALLNDQKNTIEQELNNLNEQVEAVEVFIVSLEKEENLFEQEDNYGYFNQMNALIASKNSVSESNQQLQSTYQTNVSDTQKIKDQLISQIETRQSELRDWQQVRIAWSENQQEITGFGTSISSKYALWKEELKQATENEINQLVTNVLSQIDEQIQQLELSVEQLTLEKEQISDPENPNNEIASQVNQYIQLKEQEIANAKEKKIELQVTIEKAELSLKEIKKQLKDSILTAPINGTIHLNTDYEKMSRFPQGTVIAEVYPTQAKEEMDFITQIPANEMTKIEIGLPVHFKLDEKGVSEQIYDGEITEISETSIITEQGNYFIVKGQIDATNASTIKYGLTGEISIIVGKKTYLNQLLDKIF